MDNKLIVFRGKNIRRLIHNNDWYFSIIDVVSVLSDSSNPRRYWSDLKRQLFENEGFYELYEKIVQLKLEAPDGKLRDTDCASTETLFRIVQSIPSPKAELFKRWLAKVGYQNIKEIEDPELATKRTRELYKAKGYSDDWIEKRMRGIAIREEMTDEWRNRGATEQKDYEILTAEVSKATFGLTPNQYKNLKGLEKENLRDHMDDFELIFTMLGERSTTEIHRTENSKGVTKLKRDAKEGGNIAGVARKELEKRLGRSVVSENNYLPYERKNKKKLGNK
jgi:DNA-damage-inducible protein D